MAASVQKIESTWQKVLAPVAALEARLENAALNQRDARWENAAPEERDARWESAAEKMAASAQKIESTWQKVLAPVAALEPRLENAALNQRCARWEDAAPEERDTRWVKKVQTRTDKHAASLIRSHRTQKREAAAGR